MCLCASLRFAESETGNAYNIADVRSNTSICEFAEMVALKSGRKVVFDIPDNAVSNPPDISKTILSTDKINEISWFLCGTLKKVFHIHSILSFRVWRFVYGNDL